MYVSEFPNITINTHAAAAHYNPFNTITIQLCRHDRYHNNNQIVSCENMINEKVYRIKFITMAAKMSRVEASVI